MEKNPTDGTVTYARIVVDYQAQEKDPDRVRITIGDNLIEYPGELTTQTADLTTTKRMWNSIISMPAARYMCVDVNNFYLCVPLERFEYTIMPINLVPHKFIHLFDLAPKAKAGMSTWKYSEVCMAYHKLAYWPTNYSRRVYYNESV